MKTAAKCFLLLMAILGLWIGVNSIDESPRYDKSLLIAPVNVPDEENGYKVIDKYSKFNYNTEAISLNSIVKDRKWDEKTAETLLEKHAYILAMVHQAISAPRFFSGTVIRFSEPLPAFHRFVTAWQMVLLNAKLHASKQEITPAITQISLATEFCRKIQADESALLISYLIANWCFGETFDGYHEVAEMQGITKEQLQTIYKNVNSIPSYENDGFSNVSRGQFTELHTTAATFAEDMQTRSWGENYKNYWEFGNNINSFLKAKSARIDHIVTGLGMLLPRYYFHSNKMLNKISDQFNQDILLVASDCSKDFPPDKFKDSDPYFSGHTLGDLFKPGALSEDWEQSYSSGWNTTYMERRCLYHNYFSAIKIILAMKMFELDHGKSVTKLDELVPEYLPEIPVDLFSGKPMKFDAKQQWLYSYGTDRVDNGGSIKGFNTGRCFKYDDKYTLECEQQPTYPINWADYYKFYAALQDKNK